MTGAPLPPDGAAMVMVEETQPLSGERVLLKAAVAAGAGLLQRGENHRAGTELLATGLFLNPARLGVAAHAGEGELSVAEKPALTLIPTGNELVAPGAIPQAGQIVNSSAPALEALFAAAGAGVTRAPICRDDPEALAAAIEAADGDIVLTGGVSMGDADFLPGVAQSLGFAPVFHKVAMKPGKPLLFSAHADGRVLFGLPGNPVSSFLAARLFILPWLRLRQGAAPETLLWGQLTAPLHGAGKRQNYLPVKESFDGISRLLTPIPSRGSADLGAYASADGVAVVPPEVTEIAAGETVEFIRI